MTVARRLPFVALVLVLACGSKPPASPAPASRDAIITGPSGGAIAAAPAASGPSEDDAPIPVTAKDPTWGSRNALATIVEFGDFQCPFCARADATLQKLRAQYGPENLRIVWKHLPLPFHPHARPAAEAAQGVFELGGNDAFWRFYGMAFDSVGSLPDSFDPWAAAAGVDAASFHRGIATHQWSAAVDDDAALAKKIGAVGTPTFFINGVMVSGAQPLDRFQAVIDDVLGQAKAIVGQGAPLARVYVITSTYNLQHQPEEGHDDEPKEDTTTVWKIPVGTSPSRGPAGAPVTVVEFADFQCPFCGRAEETLHQIRTKYGDRVRFVWKNEPLPFHPRAEPAAEVAYEARAEKGDAGFWDAHDRILSGQPHLDDADLLAIARDMQLNTAQVSQAIRQHKYKRVLDADSDFADDVQAAGTPHFFINGRRLVGAQPLDRFATIIDEEVTKANALLAKGVAPAALYGELIKAGKEPPPPERRTVPALASAPARGPAGAPVTIVEFADFQCPYCKKSEETIAELMKLYPGRVRVVWRNLPLSMHPDAPLAAEAAMEAYRQKGNDGFWKMHGLLFANQGKDEGLKRASLDGYARQLGLDGAKWASALDASTHQAEIDVDVKAAKDAQIMGTPSFLVNGYFLSGAMPLSKFRKLVELALSEQRH